MDPGGELLHRRHGLRLLLLGETDHRVDAPVVELLLDELVVLDLLGTPGG